MIRSLALAILLTLMVAAPGSAQPRRALRAGQPPPHLVMEQLSRMTVEERDRMFANVSPQRRANIEQRLERYNQLPPTVKQRLREEYNQFLQLTPEKQNEVRELFRQFSELPEERRRMVRREINRLRNQAPPRAMRRLNSEAFRVEFSDSERQMIERLVALLARGVPPATQ